MIRILTTGALRIAGDPGVDGDIYLRLDSNETVVSIEPNSKNLTLIKPLDKEVRLHSNLDKAEQYEVN